MRMTVSSSRKAARRVGKPEISSVITKRTRRVRQTSEERFCAIASSIHVHADLVKPYFSANVQLKPFRSRKINQWARVHLMSKHRNICPKARRSPNQKKSAASLSLMRIDQIPFVMVTGN